MKIHREWVTPLTAGAFLILGVTGILMFFHLDTGLNKLAHEWLGWALVAVVGIHLFLNFSPLKRQLARRTGQVVLASCALLLALSFLPVGSSGPGGKAAFMSTARALAEAPLPVLAQVAGVDEAVLTQRLIAAGVKPTPETRSLGELVGADPGRQVHVLAQVLAP